MDGPKKRKRTAEAALAAMDQTLAAAAAKAARNVTFATLGETAAAATTAAAPTTSTEDSKPSAKDLALSKEEQEAWKAVIDRIPRCSAVEGLRESSYYRNKYQPGSGRNACLRKLLQELGSLEDSLPTDPAIWLRFDEETPQFLRALITAPTGTPYALGLFCFDLFIPDTYPSTPPKVRLLTTGGGAVRFSPNLYENGTVCLSLLGTWSGPKWSPLHSSILQVLVSIQGLILGVEHPYYLEPGFGGWEESVNKGAPVPAHVKSSDAKIREGTVKYAMLETCKTTPRYLKPFASIIEAHFTHYKEAILKEVKAWGKMDRAKRQIHSAISQLQEELEKFKAGTENAKAAPTTGGSSSNGEDPHLAAKRQGMEEAAKRGDYVTAGQLQAELQYLEAKGVDAMVAIKRKEMEAAAAEGDYITAGQLQQRVQYLERHKRRLQELPRRMFEAAAQQDFVRAGRFQEQYQILLDSNNDVGSDAAKSTGGNPAAMWDQGAVGPSYTFFSSLPFSGGAGAALEAGLTSSTAAALHGAHDDVVDPTSPAAGFAGPTYESPFDYDAKF